MMKKFLSNMYPPPPPALLIHRFGEMWILLFTKLSSNLLHFCIIAAHYGSSACTYSILNIQFRTEIFCFIIMSLTHANPLRGSSMAQTLVGPF